MPSVPHEAIAELLRNNPKLGLALIYYMFPIPRGVRAHMGDSNLSTVVPLLKEMRGDAVIVLENEEGDFKRVVVIEPQLSPPQPWKRRSLAAYTAVAGAVHGCDSTLLMICYDPRTAEECRKKIRTGHPGFDITPYVIFGHRTPDPFDPLLSFATDELVVLACFTKALDLDDADIRDTVYKHLSSLDERRRTTYIYFVRIAASDAARRALEEKMAIDVTDDPFIAGFVAQGLAQGEASGRAEEARKILLAVLRTREIELSESDSQLVDTCADLIQLEHWTQRAALAITAAAVFGVRPHLPAQTARPIAAA